MYENQSLLIEQYILEVLGDLRYDLSTWGKEGADAIRKSQEEAIPEGWKQTKYLSKQTWNSVKEGGQSLVLKLDKFVHTKDEDLGLKKGIVGELEKFWVTMAPELSRSLLELEVEVYTHRWREGYDLRHKEIQSNKKFKKGDLESDDSSKQSGYYYRELIEKSDKSLVNDEEDIIRASVERALGDFDEDLVKDVLDEFKNKFLDIVNVKKYLRVGKYMLETYGKTGLVVCILEAILLCFSVLSMYGFFKELASHHIVLAFAGLTLPLGLSDVIGIIIEKLKEKVLSLLGEDVEDHVRNIEFVKNKIKPVKKENLMLVKYEKMKGVVIPSTGKIDKSAVSEDPVFDL